ncbi:unnamed protein product [Coregonus sp. 'balchen']|nr:unnamed protein product [Coregonus sp. 'balchen']
MLNLGSLCDGCSSQSYQLPVLGTVFVKTHWRRRGLALQILTDLYILPQRGRYDLLNHMKQRDRLYEVETPGGWGQRRNIWLNLQLNRSTNRGHL